MGRLLRAADKVALDCYRVVYTTLGTARSIPSPAPFTYMKGELGPATFRRGIYLPHVGRIRNPFPLIELPYSRLFNPWTLGAIPHETAHNLQQDLGLDGPVARQIDEVGRRSGVPVAALAFWKRWNRELFCDLVAVLMIGPTALISLSEVIARSRMTTLRFQPRDTHPTPVLRVLVCADLLRRLGFAKLVHDFLDTWLRAYPARDWKSLPAPLTTSFERAGPAVVTAICEVPYSGLGGRTLSEMLVFGDREQRMISEAALRLARGVDPGIIPERFLVSAVREALTRGLASPDTLFGNFYTALDRR
jgi:hypothetical protein